MPAPARVSADSLSVCLEVSAFARVIADIRSRALLVFFKRRGLLGDATGRLLCRGGHLQAASFTWPAPSVSLSITTIMGNRVMVRATNGTA